MRRAGILITSLLAAVIVPAVGHGQLTEFCPLLEARIVADDGQFLGRVTPDPIPIDSLVNPNGDHGSEFSQISIFNSFGAYGGMFALLSPFNPNTFFPPRIILDAQTLARLTINDEFSPRVEADALIEWLQSDMPEMCFEPTPTASPDPSTAAPATATSTPQQTPTATPFDGTPPAETPTATATNTAAPTRTPTTTTSAAPATRTPTNFIPTGQRGPEACAIAAPPANSSGMELLLPIAALWRLRRRRL